MQNIFSQKPVKNVKDIQQIKKVTQPIELLLGGGGGTIPFLMGYVHGLINIVGKEKLKQFKIGGVSAGAIVGIFIHFVINQEEIDMKYFYKNWIRKCFEEDNKKYYGLFTSGKLFEKYSYEYIKLLEKYKVSNLNETVHMSTSVLNKFFIPKNLVITEYIDASDLGEALQASAGIPFLLQCKAFYKYRGQKCIDGGFTGQIPYRYEDSQKIFLNVMPEQGIKFPFVWKQPKNMDVLHITKETQIKFPVDYWLWDAEWADDMFLRGILKAQEDLQLINDIFDKY